MMSISNRKCAYFVSFVLTVNGRQLFDNDVVTLDRPIVEIFQVKTLINYIQRKLQVGDITVLNYILISDSISEVTSMSTQESANTCDDMVVVTKPGKTVHFLCSSCGCEFDVRADKVENVRVRMTEYKNQYACPTCGKTVTE